MQKTMLLCLTFVCLCGAVSAQDTPRELGVRLDGINFGGFNSFSLVYKKPKAADKYTRWRATFGEIDITTAEYADYNFQFSAGLNFGIEKRKALSDKFQFCRGPEFGGNVYLGAGDGDPAVVLGARFGYVLGLQYNLKQHFFVNLETIPGAALSIDANDDPAVVNAGVGFNTQAALTLGYRF